MKYKVQWSQIAIDDLDAIIEYIALDNVDIALKLLSKIKECTVNLGIFPEKGRVVPELREFGTCQFRELIHTPWRIIYEIDDSVVTVHAVLDSRRNLEDLLLERLL